jgi:hypothetical protein
VTALAISAFLSIIIAVGHAQDIAPLSEIKVIVFDESGAVIPDCEIVFRSDSEAIVSHTGQDGSVTVRLRSGRYVVATNKAGFLKSKILDVQIAAAMPDTFRIVLKGDPTPTDGPIEVPTTTSDLSIVVGTEPSRVPSTQPPIRKSRSWQCLYLWKCSAL